MIYSHLSCNDRIITKAHGICGPGIRVNQPAFGCDGNRLGPANRFQLSQDRSDVTFHCSLADIKNRSDLLITSAVDDTLQNFEFTLRQFGMCYRLRQFQGDLSRKQGSSSLS